MSNILNLIVLKHEIQRANDITYATILTWMSPACFHIYLLVPQRNVHSDKTSFISYRGVHYNDVIMSTMASQITSASMVYSSVCSNTNQRKHQSSGSLAFVRGFPRGPVNSPHKRPVTRNMFPFDDVIRNLRRDMHQMNWFRYYTQQVIILLYSQ